MKSLKIAMLPEMNRVPVTKEKIIFKLGFGKDLVVACMNMSETVKVDHLLAIESLQLS